MPDNRLIWFTISIMLLILPWMRALVVGTSHKISDVVVGQKVHAWCRTLSKAVAQTFHVVEAHTTGTENARKRGFRARKHSLRHALNDMPASRVPQAFEGRRATLFQNTQWVVMTVFADWTLLQAHNNLAFLFICHDLPNVSLACIEHFGCTFCCGLTCFITETSPCLACARTKLPHDTIECIAGVRVST
jgi:hypothetical protein